MRIQRKGANFILTVLVSPQEKLKKEKERYRLIAKLVARKKAKLAAEAAKTK